ncbi:Selenide, water dikinase [Nymphon striatum]|nr:Selenide, water dikinase [Nymphon striatum]
MLQSQIPPLVDESLLVGNSTRDDAAVYDLGNGTAIISTTDFFMPIVDDPYTFGRIAATNAISDIYAMGGKPIMAIAIFGLPKGILPKVSDLRDIFINDIPLLDVRAPVEFNHGAFPNSVNIPLMDDDQREAVGIRYKEQGQDSAIFDSSTERLLIFENAVAVQLLKAEAAGHKFIVVEDEARNVGSLGIPEALFNAMKTSKLVMLEVSQAERNKISIEEYILDTEKSFEEDTAFFAADLPAALPSLAPVPPAIIPPTVPPTTLPAVPATTPAAFTGSFATVIALPTTC